MMRTCPGFLNPHTPLNLLWGEEKSPIETGQGFLSLGVNS